MVFFGFAFEGFVGGAGFGGWGEGGAGWRCDWGGGWGAEFEGPVGVGGGAVGDVVIIRVVVETLAGGVGLPFVGEIPTHDFDDG